MDIILRKEALTKGLKRYYTGKPCKRGHVAERFINGPCVECNRQHGKDYVVNNYEKYKVNHNKASKQWNIDNPKKRKAITKKYNTANKELIKDRNRKEYLSNIEKYREISRIASNEYRKKYPERRAASVAKRKAKKLQAIPLWYENEKVKLIYLKRGELSKLWGIQLHVDHIIPLQGENVCGLHCWDNLQLMEAKLNISKNNKF